MISIIQLTRQHLILLNIFRELEFNGLSGTFPNDTSKLRNLVKLSVAEQYYNDYSCTGSDGIVVNTMFAQGTEANGMNTGLQGTILGTQIGRMVSLEQLSLHGNYFSGSIASEISNLKDLGEHIML